MIGRLAKVAQRTGAEFAAGITGQQGQAAYGLPGAGRKAGSFIRKNPVKTAAGVIGAGILAGSVMPRGNEGDERLAPVSSAAYNPMTASGFDPATDPALASGLTVQQLAVQGAPMPDEKAMEREIQRLQRQQYFAAVSERALLEAEQNRKIIEDLQFGLNPGVSNTPQGGGY